MIAEQLPTWAELGPWMITRDGDPAALALYERHYSARRYRDGRRRVLFVGPGEKLVLLSHDGTALFVWRRFLDPGSWEGGVNCAVFRNEGAHLSSTLIRAAMLLAWDRWPGARLYTYVDPAAITSRNPGYCFIRAGWRPCGWTRGGHGRHRLRVLDVYP